MKKLMLCVLVTLCSMSVFAQDDTNKVDQNPKHEAKLNAVSLLIGAFDVSYEYLLNDESALGISVFVPFDKDISDDYQYHISPYYRVYFGNKYASGFYLEGFGMLNSVERNIFSSDDDYVTDFALGIGLGGKWITKSGFVGEIGFGVGRNLFNNEDTDFDVVVKGGISIGYRF